MAPTTHEIDPDADTIITLKNASNIFAPWDDEERDRLAQELEMLSLAAPNVTEPGDTDNNDVYFRVSSRHLMLASPWFRRVLKKEGWSESSRSTEDGLFHITAADWDEEAFLILLNIFHLRNRDVPRKVTLETLAKIALLVDYYECGEAIELFTAMWISSLKTSTKILAVYNRDLILWIWISWVFNESDCFRIASDVAMKQSDEPLRNLDLPIPAKVTDKIDSKRNQAMDSIIGQLHDLLETYLSTSYTCPHGTEVSFQCGSFLLGALTKELHRMEFLSPRPQIPFVELSFDGLCDKLMSLQSPVWYRANRYAHNCCSLTDKVIEIVTAATTEVTGLDLKEMKKIDPGYSL